MYLIYSSWVNVYMHIEVGKCRAHRPSTRGGPAPSGSPSRSLGQASGIQVFGVFHSRLVSHLCTVSKEQIKVNSSLGETPNVSCRFNYVQRHSLVRLQHSGSEKLDTTDQRTQDIILPQLSRVKEQNMDNQSLRSTQTQKQCPEPVRTNFWLLLP